MQNPDAKNAPREREGLFDIVRHEPSSHAVLVLVLRSARTAAVAQSTNARARVSKDEDGRANGARPLMLRDASQRSRVVEASALASCCDAPQHEGAVHFGQKKPRDGRTNLWLWEMIAGPDPLFRDCYLRWMAQLQRVEPSARGRRAGGEAAAIRGSRQPKLTPPLRRTMPDQDGGHSRLIHAFRKRLASACETPDMRNLRNLFFATPRHEKLSRGRPSSPVTANAAQINRVRPRASSIVKSSLTQF
jgi:hypothetical protein